MRHGDESWHRLAQAHYREVIQPMAMELFFGPEKDEDRIIAGLTTPIGLDRYLYPCRCEGGDCKCEAGA